MLADLFCIYQDGVWAVFAQKKDRLDCPIGRCKLFIFRFLTFLNLLILLLVVDKQNFSSTPKDL